MPYDLDEELRPLGRHAADEKRKLLAIAGSPEGAMIAWENFLGVCAFATRTPDHSGVFFPHDGTNGSLPVNVVASAIATAVVEGRIRCPLRRDEFAALLRGLESAGFLRGGVFGPNLDRSERQARTREVLQYYGARAAVVPSPAAEPRSSSPVAVAPAQGAPPPTRTKPREALIEVDPASFDSETGTPSSSSRIHVWVTVADGPRREAHLPRRQYETLQELAAKQRIRDDTASGRQLLRRLSKALADVGLTARRPDGGTAHELELVEHVTIVEKKGPTDREQALRRFKDASRGQEMKGEI